MRLALSMIAFAALAAAPAGFAQADQTLHGTVTDASCGAKHGMANMSAAQCTRACTKGGGDFALASGDKVYTLKGDRALMDKYAGQAVTVKGTVDGKVINVASISDK